MTFPAITSVYAAGFGILLVGLSIWVSVGRAHFRVHHGDGGQVTLQRRIRMQANFVEYVPLALILIALNEASGASEWSIQALLLGLLVARVIHPVGMSTPEGSLSQYLLRAPAMLATWTVIILASVMLLLR